MIEREARESALNGPVAQLDGQPPARRPLSLSERVQSLRLPDEKSGGSGGRLPWVLCLLFALGMVAAGYYGYTRDLAAKDAEQQFEQAEEGKPKSAADLASTTTAAMGDVVHESKGYIIPAHQILVSPEVSARIMKLHFVEGQRVNKNDLLAELRTVDYQADCNRAKASLDNARHRLSQLEKSLPLQIKQAEARITSFEAQRNYLLSEERSTLQARSGSTDMQRTKSNADVLQNRAQLDEAADLLRQLKAEAPLRISAAGAEVSQWQAELDKAQERLDNCKVRAPVTGTILKKTAEEGNLVNAVAFNGSFSLCEMADLSDLEVELSIQERDIARVFAGQKCKVRAEAYPKREYEGVVSRLMPIADRAKGALPVRVKLTVPREEEGIYLRPEMGAVVWFLKGEKENPKGGATK